MRIRDSCLLRLSGGSLSSLVQYSCQCIRRLESGTVRTESEGIAMRNGSKLVFLLLALTAASLAQMPPPPAAKLIKAGRVLDVKSGKYLLDQGILTEGEKIKEIGPWAEVQSHAPGNIVMIDLSQATLLPGLIDCHAHLLISGEVRRGPGEGMMLTVP